MNLPPPAPSPVNFDVLPPALREHRRWVLWRYTWNRKRQEWAKVPLRPSGANASTTDPEAWSDFETVRDAYLASLDTPRPFSGVGFVVTERDGLLGVDLDGCLGPEGLSDWARPIVAMLAPTYCEVSPSGAGLRLFVRGAIPESAGNRKALDSHVPAVPGPKRPEFEWYVWGRYLTLTGQTFEEAPSTIAEPPPAVLRAVWEHVERLTVKQPDEQRQPQPAPRAVTDPESAVVPLAVSDEALLEKARSARNGAAFSALYDRGDVSLYDGDVSRATAALLAHLAFWTSGDARRMDALFRSSALMRPKWDERRGEETWGAREIVRAIERATDGYDGRPSAPASARPSGPPEPPGVSSDTSPPPVVERPVIPARVYQLLPDWMRRGCEHFAGWHERDVFLTGLLGTLSAALPGVRFAYGGRYYSPHLYLFVLALASSGKGVLDFAFRLLDPLDDLLFEQSREARAAWEREKDEREQLRRSRDAGERERARQLGPMDPEPPERYVQFSDNTTLAGLYDALEANPEGGAILSTEADALSGANGREFGGFSYVLRKAFHHERATEQRRTTGRKVIRHPRLAVVVSGTPDQFRRLIDSIEDGLFSRFGVYRFDAPLAYVSQRPTEQNAGLAAFVADGGARVLRLWNALQARRGTDGLRPLYFDVPPALWDRVDGAFRTLHDDLFLPPEAGGRGLDPALAASVKRGALIAFRLAAVLGVWRAFEAGADLSAAASIEAAEEDVEAATLLALVYVEHALLQAFEETRRYGLAPDGLTLGGPHRMTAQQRRCFDDLPQPFGRADIEEAAEAAAVHPSTVYRWVEAWIEAGLVEREARGVHRKKAGANTANSANSANGTGPYSHDSQYSRYSHGRFPEDGAGDGAPGVPAEPWEDEDLFDTSDDAPF